MTITFEEEDFKNLFLKYQCERDMNPRFLTRNDECYTASWADFDKAMDKAFSNDYIDKALIKDKNDLSLINKSNKTLSDFEYIVEKYSNYTLETLLSTSYGLIKLPNFSTENDASLSFELDG